MSARTILLTVSISFLAILSILGLIYYLTGNTSMIALDARLEPPSVSSLAGTDELGRSIFRRTIQGAALSLWLALMAWMASLIIGLILGSLAGYYVHGSIDLVISALITYAYATPFIIFLIALLGLIGPGLINAYLILVLFAWAAPARQARAVVAGIRDAGYMKAAHSFGYSTKDILQFVVIPQVFSPVAIASLALLPEIIALDAVLAFFGLGVQPPAPSLGKMIVDGINYLSSAWWMAFFPVATLLVICLIARAIVYQLGVKSHDIR